MYTIERFILRQKRKTFDVIQLPASRKIMTNNFRRFIDNYSNLYRGMIGGIKRK